MGANWSKKVVNKGFRDEQTAMSKPNEATKKPTEIGVALLSRYSIPNGKDGFGKVSKH